MRKSSHKEKQVLSPHKVFAIDESSDTNRWCQDRDTCSRTYSYDWRGFEACQARLLCTHLSNGACGDFGLSMKTSSDERPFGDDLCYQRHLYAKELVPDDSLEVELWYTANSQYVKYFLT